ncbi:YitT family protein [Lacrimispora sp.]|uniref:YitT family protein n=1 Tax=Lacrimispora sp. TaxID=2719234 RepID=UPI0028607EA7|nr:YitT family protein [Lacrimispora sp.]MDR7813167.1 YitT family protein [Lacrimispora sp.]
MKKGRLALEILTIMLGNFIYAVGIVFFIMPSGLITGGTTGIAIAVNHYTKLPISSIVLVFNVIMFMIGLFVLGKKFALTTLISTLFFPLYLEVLQKLFANLVITDDIFLCTIFGGICIGSAIALVIRVGASTGGMSIPPLILNKYMHIPVSVSLYVGDCIILALQVAFSDKNKILYGIVLVMIYSIVLDKLLILGTNKIQIKVISGKSSEIKDAIISKFDRGVTLLHSKSGYLEREMDILLTVISNNDLSKFEKLIHEIDEEAFVIISHVNEVRGRGFSIGKKYL